MRVPLTTTWGTVDAPAGGFFERGSRFWFEGAGQGGVMVSGDGADCCGGYCRVTEEFTFPVCQDTPPALCAQEYEACNVDADCCSDDATTSCIANRCARIQLN